MDEWTALEMRRTGNRTGGSNPSLSASSTSNSLTTRGAIAENRIDEGCRITNAVEGARRAGEHSSC